MDHRSEAEIRNTAGNIALAWYSAKKGEFRGDSPRDYAEMISASHIAADESRLALHRWVDAGRRASLSWADIGQLIGTSKQAAHRGSAVRPILRPAAHRWERPSSCGAPTPSTRCRCSTPKEGPAASLSAPAP